MAHGNDSDTWPSPRGPWPEVTDLSRLFDHGQRWCRNAAGHPGTNDYPDATEHLPWFECHGPEVWLHGACRDLDGEPAEISVYPAAPFRFGQPRALPVRVTPRLVLDARVPGPPRFGCRFSLDLGEGIRLARIIEHLVDGVSFP